jgi:lambda repressor-like predicted transcriptional regulator
MKMKKPDPEAIALFKLTMTEVLETSIMKKGMTISELAKKSGLSWGTVRKAMNLETRYPRLQTAMMLARVVGIDLTPHKKRKKK